MSKEVVNKKNQGGDAVEQALNEATQTIWNFAFIGIAAVAIITMMLILVKRATRKGKSHKQQDRYHSNKAPSKLKESLKLDEKGSDRNYSEELMDRGDAYVARTHLMSPSEREVFKVLEKAYGDRYYIFPQVRVVDLIQPNTKKYHSKSKEYSSLFRQISQWHFDYVLCHREDFRFFCALELDDPSHERPERLKRDRIINKVCEVAKLRLERMKINHEEKRVELQ